MMLIRNFLHCLRGPALFRVHKSTHHNGIDYFPTVSESYGNYGTNGLCVMKSLFIYTSPFIISYLYRRDYLTTSQGIVTCVTFFSCIAIVYAGATLLKGIGRFNNPLYRAFIHQVLEPLRQGKDVSEAIKKFDCEFWIWPTQFKSTADLNPKLFLENPCPDDSIWTTLKKLPCRLLSYLMVNSFGISMVYPGSIKLLQAGFHPVLLEGRKKLIQECDGNRYKLETVDGNHIDVMYLQQKKHENGKFLVIACEGNAGFYEIGILSTPKDAGYSVLGWNHPGFGGSTGAPYPSQELNAADAVMKFAIKELGYAPSHIILNGWSIGGFSASWLAMNYPNVKAVILDATFDHILPLAVPRMPSLLEPIVKCAIYENINLNVTDQLIKYPGPIKLIRRTRDEIITTTEGIIATNRGNDLLMQLLKFRYPHVIIEDLLKSYLALDPIQQQSLITGQKLGLDEDYFNNLLISYIDQYSNKYPMMIGESMSLQEKESLTLFLASKYLIDFDSTHCTPLPSSFLSNPWEASIDSAYVNIISNKE